MLSEMVLLMDLLLGYLKTFLRSSLLPEQSVTRALVGLNIMNKETSFCKNEEMPIGWPLGLGFLNMRLRVAELLPAAQVEPYSLHIPSTSFSSFSSSNLDTESTTSFFQDNSVSLGRLIGIRPGERGRLYFPNSLRFEERERKTSTKGSCSDASNVQEVEMSRGICIPILLDALLKISKSKKRSRN